MGTITKGKTAYFPLPQPFSNGAIFQNEFISYAISWPLPASKGTAQGICAIDLGIGVIQHLQLQRDEVSSPRKAAANHMFSPCSGLLPNRERVLHASDHRSTDTGRVSCKTQEVRGPSSQVTPCLCQREARQEGARYLLR